MRLLQLDLLKFGPFTGQGFDFSRPGLHVIYGPNEAGKSSTLRAVIALLFGIPQRSADNFVHAHGDMRIGGRIEDHNGNAISIIRRKGRANTLHDGEGRVLADQVLEQFLGHIDESFFRMMFGLDHLRLREGGDALLKGEGDAGTSLFAAAAGMTGLASLLAEIDDEASGLFLPKGKNPAINAAVRLYRQAKSESLAEVLSPEKWLKAREEKEVLGKHRNSLNDEDVRLRTEVDRLTRIGQCVTAFCHLRKTRSALDELENVPDLPADATSCRERAIHQRETAQSEWSRLSKEEQDLTAAIEKTEVPDDILAHDREIEELFQRSGGVENTQADLPKRRAERERLEAEAIALARQIQPAAEAPDPRAFLIDKPVSALIRDLITAGASHGEKHAAARRVVEKYTDLLRRDNTALSELPKTLPYETLARPLERVRGLGPLGRQRHKAEQAFGECQREAEPKLAALPNWDASLDALAETPFPSTETIERHRKTIESLTARSASFADKIANEDNELAKIDKSLAELEAGGAIATLEAVFQARQQRDRMWSRIRSEYIGRAAAPSSDPQPVPEDYENAVRVADDLSDRRTTEADRVANHAALTQQRAAVGKSRDEAAKASADTKDDRACAETDWRALWRDVGITPLSPEEMLAWMRQRGELLEIREEIRRLESEANALRREESAAKDLLSKAMAELDEATPDREAPLDDWLDKCSDSVRRALDLEKRKDALRDRIREHEENLAEARRELNGAEADRSGWKVQWRDAVTRIQQKADITPPELNVILDLATKIEILLGKSDDLAQRTDAMDRDVLKFTEDVTAIAEKCEFEFDQGDPIGTVRALKIELRNALKNQEKNEQAQRRLEEVKKAQWRVANQIDEAGKQLAEFCRRAGCVDIDGLPAIEEKSARKRTLVAELEKREEELVEHGGGRTLEQIHEDVAAEDADSLPSRIHAAKRETEENNAEIQRVSVRLGERQNELDSMDGGDAAAEAQQRAEELRAAIRTASRRYVRLKLSAEILRRSIESYREKNQAPLLWAASQFFEKLTVGKYAALKTTNSADGVSKLVGLRPDGGQVAVPLMSDGARDQLYLALRLAALESYLAHNPPLPLIADDLLIHFDTQRAAAAFEILCELAKKTQILFFTHHDHLARLAMKTLGTDRVEHHELGARTPS